MASQISRIFFIDQRIRTAGKVTLKEIMQQGEVSTITAKRDIETLKPKSVIRKLRINDKRPRHQFS